jgi:hypothetical protein
MSKDITKRYEDRQMVLIAETKDSLVVLPLIGNVSSLAIERQPTFGTITLSPNPVSGATMLLSLELAEHEHLSFAIFDMLGREVVTLLSSYYSSGKQSVLLPVSTLVEGGYILRVSDGSSTKSISFRVVR